MQFSVNTISDKDGIVSLISHHIGVSHSLGASFPNFQDKRGRLAPTCGLQHERPHLSSSTNDIAHMLTAASVHLGSR